MRKLTAMVLALPLLLAPATGYAEGLGSTVLKSGKMEQPENAARTLKDVAYTPSPSSNLKSSTSLGDRYVVISNESTDEISSQSTGSLELKSLKTGLKSGTYQVDYNKPFDGTVSQNKVIRKSMLTTTTVYHVGDSKLFWVTDLNTNQNYQISARLAYSGTKAQVWVNNNQISDTDAAKLGAEFDTNIYPEVTNNFGAAPDINHDGKINILCYDIQDDFAETGGYVAGYFGAEDLYNTAQSNKSEIFYIDTYPTMGTGTTKDVTQAYSTLAHEFQHMVNFNQNVLVEKGDPMDTWLDEGLAMASEQIYSGHGQEDRLAYYNESAAIRNGQSLLYWDDAGDTLANYSLSYLFIQYLKIQCGQGDRIFKEIIDDPNNNYKAVEDVAKKYISPNITFGKLMTDFRIALLLKSPTGLYGFKGDPFFDSINPQIFTGSTTNLRGGGAVVESFNSAEGFSVPVNKGANVTYTFLNKDQGTGPANPLPLNTPVVSTIWNSDTQVKGTADPDTTVSVYVGQKEIGIAYTSSSGAFTINIPQQAGGTVVQIFEKDDSGNVSSAASITVKTVPLEGWVKSGGSWYYYNLSTEKKVTGWLQVNGKWYYFNGNGVMKTGWLQSGSTWYYLDASGAMKTGWVKIGTKWYYLASNGAMKIGWIQTGGKWYYLYKDGSMAYNTTINGYKLGAGGAWVGSSKTK
ncbi:hypothetical protein HPT25_04495 [Bacillus sp. BRMEA1]|uniref:Ig-like domain-containing protein n=1 Tax=Neobacillus endophyticus TaxID=2738405 RepID=UPI001564EAC9|nr:Ig-like domain-containing protein [Neobacillus endophyticus]NRD76750.1 hypothetical protein [Neobacillus endophyticus]